MRKRSRAKVPQRKHAVYANLNVPELTKAGSGLELHIYASGEKLGEVDIGRGASTGRAADDTAGSGFPGPISRRRWTSWRTAATSRRSVGAVTIWTIGHSTRSIEDFLAILGAHGIETVVDVRRFPGLRRLPQFGAVALESVLAKQDVDYRWIGELEGTVARPGIA